MAGVAGDAAARIPTRKDLRDTWWRVADQGSTGSCVGWAAADSVLRWHLVKAGRLRKDELLSPRFVWMASKETDEFSNSPTTFIENSGTSLKSALDVARKYGAVKENVLPFAGGLYPGDPATFYALAAQMKIQSYFNLSLNRGGSLFLTRPTLGHYVATREELLERAASVLGDLATGRLHLEIGGRYPLEDAARAYDDLEGRRTTGKLLLIP